MPENKYVCLTVRMPETLATRVLQRRPEPVDASDCVVAVEDDDSNRSAAVVGDVADRPLGQLWCAVVEGREQSVKGVKDGVHVGHRASCIAAHIGRKPASRSGARVVVYLASLLNQRGVLQAASAWQQASGGRADPAIEDFLARAYSFQVCLLRMAALEQARLAQFQANRRRLTLEDDLVIFWSPSVVEILNECSTALSALRQMQNYTPRMLARKLGTGRSAPASMKDCTRGKMKKAGFPDGIAGLITDYWEEHGCRVKAYRDLDMHYANAADHTFIQVEPSVRLIVPLPDNPGARSRKAFTFAEEVSALEFLREQFAAFDTFFSAAATQLGLQPAPISQSVGMGGAAEMREGVKRSFAMMVEDTAGRSGMVFTQLPDRRIQIEPFKGGS